MDVSCLVAEFNVTIFVYIASMTWRSKTYCIFLKWIKDNRLDLILTRLFKSRNANPIIAIDSSSVKSVVPKIVDIDPKGPWDCLRGRWIVNQSNGVAKKLRGQWITSWIKRQIHSSVNPSTKQTVLLVHQACFRHALPINIFSDCAISNYGIYNVTATQLPHCDITTTT